MAARPRLPSLKLLAAVAAVALLSLGAWYQFVYRPNALFREIRTEFVAATAESDNLEQAHALTNVIHRCDSYPSNDQVAALRKDVVDRRATTHNALREDIEQRWAKARGVENVRQQNGSLADLLERSRQYAAALESSEGFGDVAAQARLLLVDNLLNEAEQALDEPQNSDLKSAQADLERAAANGRIDPPGGSRRAPFSRAAGVAADQGRGTPAWTRPARPEMRLG